MEYRFTNAVEAAIAENRAELLGWRKAGLISSDQVREMHESFMLRCLYGAREENNPDRAVGVQCPECKLVHAMPASIKIFQCKCTPRQDRQTALNRVPLL